MEWERVVFEGYGLIPILRSASSLLILVNRSSSSVGIPRSRISLFLTKYRSSLFYKLRLYNYQFVNDTFNAFSIERNFTTWHMIYSITKNAVVTLFQLFYRGLFQRVLPLLLFLPPFCP
ncbi:MAG: hypothetical protein ACD_48C00591G0001 [uncultured bacterium]|nr:MAG: hypothetical protein ACD_48C00591G0001 [uncultured bacterium]